MQDLAQIWKIWYKVYECGFSYIKVRMAKKLA